MDSFTDKVRSIVANIPAGQTMTYGGVANAAGNPKAARAVANIMAKNYDPAVPCHRVIRNDGSLGGYNRGGIAAKRVILLAEGTQIV